MVSLENFVSYQCVSQERDDTFLSVAENLTFHCLLGRIEIYMDIPFSGVILI